MDINDLKKLAGIPILEEYTGPGFVTDIEEDTTQNTDFRREIYTTDQLQLVLMSVETEIGMEVHKETSQFIRVDAGEGYVVLDGVRTPIKDGSAIVVPAGTEHNVVNTGKTPLQIYTVYAPPHHVNGVVHHTKAEADADKKDHFDGNTDQ